MSQHGRTGFAFLVPFGILYVIIVAIPVVLSVGIAFSRFRGLDPPTLGVLENFERMVTDARLHKAVWNTAAYAVMFLAVTLPLSLGLALALNSPRLPGRHLLRAAYFLPYITATVVAGTVFRFVLEGQFGLVNQTLGSLGIEGPDWLLNPQTVLPSVVFVGIWRHLGVFALYYLAALRTIPEEVIEAARVDGASSWGVLRYIILPLLRPITAFVVVIGLVTAASVFTEPLIMTRPAGGPNDSGLTLFLYMYQVAFRDLNLGYAAAIGLVFAVILGAAALLQMRLFGQSGSRA